MVSTTTVSRSILEASLGGGGAQEAATDLPAPTGRGSSRKREELFPAFVLEHSVLGIAVRNSSKLNRTLVNSNYDTRGRIRTAPTF